MSKLDEKALEAAVDALKAQLSYGELMTSEERQEHARISITAYLSSSPAAEPVAWRWRYVYGGGKSWSRWYHTSHPTDACPGSEHFAGREVEPLFASPPAPLPATELVEALEKLVNAKALKGVRELVAGWNDENRPAPYAERHPSNLGASLPKTTAGAVYELDEALTAARSALAKFKEQSHG